MSSLGKSKSTDRKEYMRNWREANPEKVRAQQRAYREANPEKVRAQQRAYREANPEKVRAQQKAYREANPEKVLAQQRAWREANPERVRETQRAYREANPEKVRAQQQAWRDANPELLIKIQRKSRAVRKKRSQTDPDVALRNMVNSARTRAKKAHREFDIDVDYVKKLWQRQQGLCKLSGLPMSIAIGSAELRVSLDRKNNAKGYVKGNVQLLRSMVNNAKNKYSQTDFVNMCRAVAKINPK
jgi:non-canonical (house-cleaning) NTP pyrophosphatase